MRQTRVTNHLVSADQEARNPAYRRRRAGLV